jgi:hypothetical protein
MMSRSPFSPRFQPFSANNFITPLASVTVRTNGIMIFTLVSPISSRLSQRPTFQFETITENFFLLYSAKRRENPTSIVPLWAHNAVH